MFQKSICLLLINLLVIGSCSNKKSTIVNTKPEYEEMYLETEYPIVGCGNIFYAYGFKFKSVKNNSSIVGIIRCPDDYGQNFLKEGRKYNIKYTDSHLLDSIKGYSLTNPFSESKLPTYLITEITKAIN